MKTLHNSDMSEARKNVPDVVFFDDGDRWELLSKASSENEGWMKSTKAMEIENIGCIVQVTTQQRNPDGSYAIGEALTFVPNTTISVQTDRDGMTVSRSIVHAGEYHD